MKNIIPFIILLVLVVSTSNVSIAQEYSRVVTIKSIHPISSQRPTNPTYQNLVRVYVNVDGWGGSSCRTDAADIKSDEKHLMSTLMIAMALKKQLKISVDDTLKPADQVCQVVSLILYN